MLVFGWCTTLTSSWAQYLHFGYMWPWISRWDFKCQVIATSRVLVLRPFFGRFPGFCFIWLQRHRGVSIAVYNGHRLILDWIEKLSITHMTNVPGILDQTFIPPKAQGCFNAPSEIYGISKGSLLWVVGPFFLLRKNLRKFWHISWMQGMFFCFWGTHATNKQKFIFFVGEQESKGLIVLSTPFSFVLREVCPRGEGIWELEWVWGFRT